jgi:glutamate--cysteine ligase
MWNSFANSGAVSRRKKTMIKYAIHTKEKLEAFIVENWNNLNEYIDNEMQTLPISFYNSVDIRESKTKVAPVDNNIYPAGFNNLCALDLDASTKNFKEALKKLNSQAQKIAIIPESHTKNLFYLDHLAILGKTIRDAGFDIIFGTFDEALFEPSNNHLDLISQSGFDVRIEKLSVLDSKIISSMGEIDVAILNNDQSNPLALDWSSLTTPVAPTPAIGWFRRQKSEHFCYYNKVVEKFCQTFSIDPGLVQAAFKKVEHVDFSARQGIEELASAVDEMASELPIGTPIFVKASQGTYGMGISVVRSGDEIRQMNKKVRNKMDIGKNSLKFTSVLVQEGIETILKYDDAPAEVTIYLIGGKSVGGFMRTNSEKGADGNLNSRGMVFRKFCISEIRQNQDHVSKEAFYTIIARLSAIASGFEIADVSEKRSLL